MVSIRFTCFVLEVMLIFLALRNSFAYSHKDMEKIVVGDGSEFAVAEGNLFKIKKGISCATTKVAEARNGRLGGRKMMEERILEEAVNVNKEGANGGDSKISGATHSVGNYKYHKGIKGLLNVEHKLRNSGPPPVNVKMVGSVALNADYHDPRSHPPKNN